MDFRTRFLIGFARALGWVVRVTARRRLRTASPEKRQRIEQMLAETETMRRDSKALLKRTQGVESGRVVETLEATLEFTRKYSSPEQVRSLESQLESLRTRKTESKDLEALRESAGDDLEKQVALMRQYHETHPDSQLGLSSLIGSLRRAGNIDEAISLCFPEDSLLGQYRYHSTLSHLLLDKKDWDGAIEQANLMIQCQQTNPMLQGRELALSSQLIIASALAGKGKKAEARKLFEKCLRSTREKNIRELIRKSMTEAGL